MRLGKVIGRVTLSRVVPELEGGRWLIVNPCNRENFPRGDQAPETLSREPSLVAFDNLGGAPGDLIGFVEGREAAQPFPVAPPIDAINAALIDHVFYRPMD